MSTDSAGVHGHRRVGEPAWRNPVANQAFNGFNPHTKVVSATERIRSLTERGSRATSGAQHLDDQVDQALCLTLITNAAVLDDDLPRLCARRAAAQLTPPSTTRSTSTAPAPSTSKPSCVAQDTARCAHRPPDLLAAGRRDQFRSAADTEMIFT